METLWAEAQARRLERRRRDEALGLHEDVEDADQRGALAGEILDVEELEAQAREYARADHVGDHHGRYGGMVVLVSGAIDHARDLT